jgi:hypothetical protein
MPRIEVLPAAHGDALLLEWQHDGATHRMLVDGGPLGTYRGVHDRLAALPQRDLDLLVVTHIDGDHIEGVVRLLQDRAAMGLRIGDVWFNGWPQLERVADTLGADQGEMVGALLRRDTLPWNAAFDGGPVVVPAEGPLPVREVGGARITLLGPGPDELRALKRDWVKVLKEIGVTPGRADEALARLAKRKALAGVEDVLGGDVKLDSSVANGSSVAFLFECGGTALLLTGDSHGSVLARGIRRLLAERREDRLAVDAYKLQHHGSAANVTDEVLALVASPRFLVSTNGARYHHPDEAALLRILDGPARAGAAVELVFNYASKTTEPWGDPARIAEHDYVATFPADATSGAVLTW